MAHSLLIASAAVDCPAAKPQDEKMRFTSVGLFALLLGTAACADNAEGELEPAGDAAIQARVRNAMPNDQLSAWSFSDGIGTPMFQRLAPGASTEELTMAEAPEAFAVDRDGDEIIDLWFGLEAGALESARTLTVTMESQAPMLRVEKSDGTALQIFPSDSVPQFANLRVLHLSPDAPAVSVFGRATGAPNSSAQRLVEALAFTNSTGYLKVSPAAYDLDVTPAAAPVRQSALSVEDVALEGLTFYTVTAFDTLANLQALPLVDDLSATAEGSTRVRVSHTAAGVGVVNVLVRDTAGMDSPLIEALAFGTAAAALELPAAEYTVGLDVDGDFHSDLLFELPPLPAGEALNVFAVNDGGSVFLAVQTGDGTVLQVPATAAEKSAEVRAIHLSPDAPTVDVLVDGAIAFGAVSFGEGSAFAPVSAGLRQVAVTPTEAGLEGAVLTADVELAADIAYTVAAFDRLENITPLVLIDDVSPPAGIRVRPVHTASGVGQVDVLAIIGDERVPLAVDLDFGTAGAALELDPGQYTLGLDLDENGIEDLRFGLPALPAGLVANAFVVIDGDGAVQLALQTLDGVSFVSGEAVAPPAEIRVLHLSPDAPAVDAFVGTVRAVEELVFTEGTPYLPVPSGETRFAVTPAGAERSAAVIDVGPISLDPETRYTAVAFNRLDAIEPLLLVDADQGIGRRNARVRFVHTGVHVGDVDVFLLPAAGAVVHLASDIEFGEAGATVDVNAGHYTLGFDLNDDHVLDAAFALPNLRRGEFSNIFAVSDAAGVLSLIVQ